MVSRNIVTELETNRLTIVLGSGTKRPSRSFEGVAGDGRRLERDAVPAGGVRGLALGRLREPARPALRLDREELAAR